jgi:hypothetical protein
MAEIGVEELILVVKDHEAIYDASRGEYRNCDQLVSMWKKIAQEMGVGKWSASVFCYLL